MYDRGAKAGHRAADPFHHSHHASPQTLKLALHVVCGVMQHPQEERTGRAGNPFNHSQHASPQTLKLALNVVCTVVGPQCCVCCNAASTGGDSTQATGQQQTPSTIQRGLTMDFQRCPQGSLYHNWTSMLFVLWCSTYGRRGEAADRAADPFSHSQQAMAIRGMCTPCPGLHPAVGCCRGICQGR